jgi:hypothetical protein
MKVILPATILLAAGLLVVVLSGCSAASLAGTRKDAAPAPAATSLPPHVPSVQPVVPSIDVAAARIADTETATFALG